MLHQRVEPDARSLSCRQGNKDVHSNQSTCQQKQTNLLSGREHANPLMLLACSVNTPIHNSRFHFLVRTLQRNLLNEIEIDRENNRVHFCQHLTQKATVVKDTGLPRPFRVSMTMSFIFSFIVSPSTCAHGYEKRKEIFNRKTPSKKPSASRDQVMSGSSFGRPAWGSGPGGGGGNLGSLLGKRGRVPHDDDTNMTPQVPAFAALNLKRFRVIIFSLCWLSFLPRIF